MLCVACLATKNVILAEHNQQVIENQKNINTMKIKITLLFVVIAVLQPLRLFAADKGNAGKPRVIVLTDIENEPDDAMSMVRFLTYSNQWDVEGIVATTSVHQKKETAAWRIREIVTAYGKVRDNLLKHEKGYPSAGYLLSVIKEGRLTTACMPWARAWTLKDPN